ncbi:hypothetical protein Tco_0684486 [Tanacetum coccineum]|uniref:Uncharacterized protein n=1 Tax=Tanacetum coccineum TaxID=301880 RepID=A0ABQ4X0S5_9ASTR
MWCLFNEFLTSVEQRLQAALAALVLGLRAMQEEIHEFERLRSLDTCTLSRINILIIQYMISKLSCQPEGFVDPGATIRMCLRPQESSLWLKQAPRDAKAYEMHLTAYKADSFDTLKEHLHGVMWMSDTNGEVLLVQLNFLDIGLLAGHPKAEKSTAILTTEAEYPSPYQDAVLMILWMRS